MSKYQEPPLPPDGCRLLHTLRGHEESINRVAWSSDGALLASAMGDGSISVWNAGTGTLLYSLQGHTLPARGLAWSPDRLTLASTSDDGSVGLWDVRKRLLLRKFEGDDRQYLSDVSWSPDSRLLAVGGASGLQVRLVKTGEVLWMPDSGKPDSNEHVAWSPSGKRIAFSSQNGFVVQEAELRDLLWQVDLNLPVRSLAWSPDSHTLAVAANTAIQIWDVESGLQAATLEGHTGPLSCLAFSHNGRYLASKSTDGTVRLWHGATWEMLAVLEESTGGSVAAGIAFHPGENILATLGERDTVVRVWELDDAVLLGSQPHFGTGRYTNAKVVLVGDSGVGKSGLGLVLSGQTFAPTDSTHGRRVWLFDKQEVALGGGRSESREMLLWDLAGQPGYRVFHRQHLNEVAVALVLFDSRSEIDPFAGVAYWARALDEATGRFPLVKFLVAARADRGGPPVSNERIEEVWRQYGFAGYFETSARRGTGVRELADAVRAAVAWDKLPRVITTAVFYEMKSLVVEEKKAGRIVQRRPELLRRFILEKGHVGAFDEAGFDTCLELVEAAGLVKSLAFGNLVLLQPEMLDDYGAWMAQAARQEPDGLGFISDKRARDGDFPMDARRMLRETPEERLLITATVEDIVARGIALRQPTERGEMLIFPSEMRTDIPDYPGGYARAVTFSFEGPVKAIYATLAVCLAHAPAFSKESFFRNAALFRSPGDEVCGFVVEYPDRFNDSVGKLTVFFDATAGKPTKLTFLRYVNRQLEALALKGSVTRERVYYCDCGYPEPVPQTAVEWRRRTGQTTVICTGCGRHIPIDDYAEQSAQADAAVDRQMALSDEERERQSRLTVLNERESRDEFHVFLCHNDKDKPEVRLLAKRLRQQGLLPWFDEEGIMAGEQFVPALESLIASVPAAAIIIGPNSFGRWQEQEYFSFLQRAVEQRGASGRRQLKLIPVLLPGAPTEPDLPLFLRGWSRVDFRVDGGLENNEPLRRLVQAIIGPAGER